MSSALNEKKMTNQERSDLSDKKMLAAAVELILSKGTEKTTLKEVGEKAGYSRGLAGYRFGSKSGLFAFTMQALGNYWLHYLKDVAQGKIGLEAINAATDAHLMVLDEDFDNVRVFYILWFEALRDEAELKKIVESINLRRHDDVVAWIKSDSSLSEKHGIAEDIASLYNSALNGIVYQYLLNPEDAVELQRLHKNLKVSMKTMLEK
ncbi:MAG: TetR/AcrR family transcriptional regulator [Arenicella sp.]